MKIAIKRVDKSLPLPDFEEYNPKTKQRYPAEQVAGFDFYCREEQTIAPHSIGFVPINNVVAVPPGYFLLLVARSSTPWKRGLMLANGVGVVDPCYSGDKDELVLELLNFTGKPVTVEKGERLAQGIIVKREAVEWREVETMGSASHDGYIVAASSILKEKQSPQEE